MLQLGQRPLSASAADASLFVNRAAELASIHRALSLGFNTYLRGEPGSGKTSLLRRVVRDFEPQSYTFLPPEMAATLAGALTQPERNARDEATAQLPESLHPWLDSHGDRGRSGERHLIVLDSPHPDLVLDVFGRGRDDLWEYPLRWIVAGTHALRVPADSFFDATVTLGPLDQDTAAQLLRRRSTTGSSEEAALLDEMAPTIAAVLGPATPRRVLAAARMVMLAAEPTVALAELDRRADVQVELSESARRVLAFLTVTGPTYAGDERLLTEMGMTRSRIVQIFQELERAGLVVGERVGKRKLYGPAPVVH